MQQDDDDKEPLRVEDKGDGGAVRSGKREEPADVEQWVGQGAREARQLVDDAVASACTERCGKRRAGEPNEEHDHLAGIEEQGHEQGLSGGKAQGLARVKHPIPPGRDQKQAAPNDHSREEHGAQGNGPQTEGDVTPPSQTHRHGSG